MKFPRVVTKGAIVLLWARYSGSLTSTSYNPEGDSDVKGQEQLFKMLSSTSTAITIGYDNASGQGYHSKYYLGEDFFKEGSIKIKGRGGQLSFFLALMEHYPGRLYQIGQKIGAMDAAALVGIPTVYTEDVDSPASGRIENWIGAVPVFRRALINEPPTVLGKAMRSLDKVIKRLQEKSKQPLPTCRQKDPNMPMPRDQWRRIVMLYQGLIEPSCDAEGQESDADRINRIMTITKKCFDANEAIRENWDQQIKALTPTQLETSQKTKPFPGYTQEDLNTIKDVFDRVVEDYSKTGSIIRNAEGKYVARA